MSWLLNCVQQLPPRSEWQVCQTEPKSDAGSTDVPGAGSAFRANCQETLHQINCKWLFKALEISFVSVLSSHGKQDLEVWRRLENSFEVHVQGDCLVLMKALLASTDGPEVLLVCQDDSKPTKDSWESSPPSQLKVCWRNFGQQLLAVWGTRQPHYTLPTSPSAVVI